VLVRPSTEAEDIAGFHAARGIVTSEGGKASHAALVARGMGVPAVTGAAALEIDVAARCVRVGESVLQEGDLIAIDGSTGAITTADVPLVVPEVGEDFEQVLTWADAHRRLGVRTNADTPEDAIRARGFGAAGIGLCRTEHMFFGEERQAAMVRVILADEDHELHDALGELLPHQQRDFEGIFEAMAGLPVTIRLLDPPLHEFLPPLHQAEADVERARIEQSDELAHLEHTADRVRALQETNPMLGTRGVRLGILYPEIYKMQCRAIFRAAKAVHQRGDEPSAVEIMIPLIDYERELELVRDLVEQVGDEEGAERGSYLVGTMIELPRACAQADRIAEHADFFSFGTNDLTQTTLGFSRDDIEGKILGRYIDLKIFDRSPFETIDQPGVGQFVRMGAWLGRTRHPQLHLGVCGEHGGDPDSIDFFHHSGLDYVSCSPYRVPVARVAAAQAAIADGAGG
jgi:pyruvate, orthophosphate dikinase